MRDFLVYQPDDTQALDFQTQDIFDGQSNLVRIVLCRYSFTGSSQPNTYQAANARLARRTDLAKAVPKSYILSTRLFTSSSGPAPLGSSRTQTKFYDIAACVTLVWAQGETARRNPENYVFFIAHMYHMLGTDEGDVPESIRMNWDFAADGSGQAWVYGAIPTVQVG
ncbi:hypothetical protein F4860DRAFT_509835 [Xylaria cubensis]|nr:hypothetical protein F4860DRAFT_509835 [Xylaria cubensis]